MGAMLDWIGENSSYDTDVPPMTVRPVTQEDLQVVYYGRLPGPNEVFLTVEAIYREDGVVWISDEMDPDSPSYELTILHELVHHVQQHSGREFACVAEREVDAYALGDHYAITVLDEPDLVADALVVMMITQCQRFR